MDNVVTRHSLYAVLVSCFWTQGTHLLRKQWVAYVMLHSAITHAFKARITWAFGNALAKCKGFGVGISFLCQERSSSIKRTDPLIHRVSSTTRIVHVLCFEVLRRMLLVCLEILHKDSLAALHPLEFLREGMAVLERLWEIIETPHHQAMANAMETLWCIGLADSFDGTGEIIDLL